MIDCMILPPYFYIGAYCHPSHPRIVLAYREVADDVVKAAKSPILCYAAGDDGDGVKPGGNDEKLLAALPASVNGTKNEFKAFPDVKHGWVTRLPLEQPVRHWLTYIRTYSYSEYRDRV